MRNLEKFSANVISKSEMMKVLGGTIECTITIHGNVNTSYTGTCSSQSLSECGSYAATQAANLNAAGGYPGVSWDCKRKAEE